MDASDLITLPVLGISWVIWQRVPTTSLNLSPLVWVVAALGVMSTLATSCLPPDTGIRELCLDNGRVVTLTVRGVYASSDGGLTWQAMGEDHQNIECLKETRLDVYSRDSRAWLMTHRSQNFRFAPGDGIYSYTNQVEYLEIDLTALGRKTREVYYEGAFPKVTCEGVVYLPGPLDAISELQSGHLIVAMGLDGILVRDSQGMWQWISVGDYEYAQIDFADSFYLIAPQIITAIVLLFLLPLIFYKLTQEATWLFTVALSLALFACFINIIFGGLPLVFMIFGLGPIGLVVSAIYFMLLNGYVFLNYWQDYASRWPVVMVIVCSLWVIILTLLPYLLWVQGTIPVQGTANAFALLLGGAGFLASLQYLNKRFGGGRKKKKREELRLDEIYFDDATMN